MLKSRNLVLATLSVGLASCTSPVSSPSQSSPQVQRIHDVRTTAYTHTESDHVAYGVKTAAGSNLKYGSIRSAAADWSVYPVGTVFQIEGDPTMYEVDDYGSALVGTSTIDLYKPSKAAMNAWGVRHVSIKVVKWGSFIKSLALMKPREKKSPHVREMVRKLERGTPRAVS